MQPAVDLERDILSTLLLKAETLESYNHNSLPDPYWFGRRRRRTRFLHSASKFFRIIKHGFKGTYHRIKSHWEQGDFENHSHQTSANSSLHKSKRQDLSRESSTEKKLEKKSKDDIETDMEKLEKLLKGKYFFHIFNLTGVIRFSNV